MARSRLMSSNWLVSRRKTKMEDVINDNKPVDNSFYDAVMQEIIEWEREKALEEMEKKNDTD